MTKYDCETPKCKRIRKKCGIIKKEIDDIMKNGGDSNRLTILNADLVNCVKEEEGK